MNTCQGQVEANMEIELIVNTLTDVGEVSNRVSSKVSKAITTIVGAIPETCLDKPCEAPRDNCYDKLRTMAELIRINLERIGNDIGRL